MTARGQTRARERSARRFQRLVVEPMEPRTLLAGAPFAVGGDPSVNPADFRVTTFASGLNYPKGLMTLPDGSLLVAVKVSTNYVATVTPHGIQQTHAAAGGKKSPRAVVALEARIVLAADPGGPLARSQGAGFPFASRAVRR